MAALQKPDGQIGIIAPNPRGDSIPGAGWGDAATVCPWTLYEFYGDKSLLEEHYPMMKKWVDYIRSVSGENGLWQGGSLFGDRPDQMICFIECRHVGVSGITLKNSSSRNLFLHGSEYVKINGIKVLNEKTHANSDGIDIDCCRYVTVSDCIIDTGDDCIAIRGDSNRLKSEKRCEYVAVSNCVLSNSTCAVRIGVGTGEIHHINISGLILARTGEGITLQTDFHGNGNTHITDINITDVIGDEVGSPIQMFAVEQ